MPWTPRDQAQMRKTNTESDCKHFSSGYLRNPWKCQKDSDENSLLKGMTLLKGIFFTKTQSSCIHESVAQVNAGLPPPPAQQQLTRTMGGTMPGQWAPGLHSSSNRSGILSRALHTPQALSPTLFPCGIVWVAGRCEGFSQLHGNSSQWEFSRAASGIVQSRWEFKEQRATLKHFLGPQSPSSSLQLCLRPDSAASEKSATPKIADERGIQDFSLYYWKALRQFQCSVS